MAEFRKNRRVKSVLPFMREHLSQEQIDRVLDAAETLYNGYLSQDIPKGERMHAESVFRNVALYQALCAEIDQQDAYDVVASGMYSVADKAGRLLDRITRLPGMAGAFMRLFEHMVEKTFGDAADFRKDVLVKTPREFRFNMTRCPYVKYHAQCGCPELCAISCITDEHSYGAMTRVAFERTQTLGRGGEVCDFRFFVR